MDSILTSVFLKAPRPGFVKTRLAESIGADAACAAYRHLVEKVLSNLQDLKAVELRYAPDTQESALEIRPWLRANWSLRAQTTGTLGDRMAHAIREGLAAGYQGVILIGSDCPAVTRADIETASNALSGGTDLVLGPALDGGYWLIGTKTDCPELFDGIEWSTERVLSQTLAAAARLGFDVKQLRTLNDIDTVEDWEAYRKTLTTEDA